MKLSRTTTAVAALALALIGATIAAMVAHAGSSGAKTITVKETEYHLALSAKTAAPGAVVFLVRNAGKYPHALAVAGPGVAKRTRIIKPGGSAKLAATLRSGRYSLWCPVPGHAAKGMKASLRVGGSAAAATTTAPATSTSGGEAWG